jgi:hypothetical protein
MGALDGGGWFKAQSWTEVDRQTDSQDFKSALLTKTASFAVSIPAEFRFIRLTQTDKNHGGRDDLRLYAVEFFGTLSE